jgi:glycosyltransferase involved in cell wall biosynthesis
MAPKISVVMSVFNGDQFLAQSVEAILNQTFQDFEFIIIDDASTDNCWEILNSFSTKDHRIKLSRNDKNIGIEGFIKNLNYGCSIAKGTYIARIDQDDVAREDRLQLQFDFLESNPDIFIVGSALQKIDEKGKHLGLMSAPLDDKAIREIMPKKISLYHPAIMFKKSFVGNFYREKIRYCEDYDFYLRIMTDNLKMANLPDCLLEYRILEKSMSRQQDKVIKNLFINKAKEFFYERLQTGNDTYDLFDPEEYLNIYTKPTKLLVKKAITVSVKYYDFSGFQKMMNLYADFGKDIFYFRNKPLLSFGASVFHQYAKLINNTGSK